VFGGVKSALLFGDFDGVRVCGGLVTMAGVGVKISGEDEPLAVAGKGEVGFDAGVFAVVVIRHIDEAFGLQDADVDEWSLIAEGTAADRGRVESVDPLAVTGWIEAHASAAGRGHAAGTAAITGEKFAVGGDVVGEGPVARMENEFISPGGVAVLVKVKAGAALIG